MARHPKHKWPFEHTIIVQQSGLSKATTTKRSEEARRKKEKLEEQLKASQLEEEKGGEDGRSFVSNLTNITDYSKRDLYNKLKEMQIALANQPGSPKEGTTFDVLKIKKT